ncbi:MAG: purine-nucleoside phosphorylase [Bacteroidetes bacterium]|nr:purine-nucleoside phosphorylase [Bacteroidota bacterium]
MTEQRKRILESVKAVKKNMPAKLNPKIGLIVEDHYPLPYGINVLKKLDYVDIPPKFEGVEREHHGKLYFAKAGSRDMIIFKGRFHFYDGYSMRDIGHIIYLLSHLGIEKILSIDEVGSLNPRFDCGELALIYDHINFMGDNPLIGENDENLGIRFPDMSNAYDRRLYEKIYKIFQDQKVKINESVYLSIIGPQSETEAEARFYRDIGCDVLGYSLAPENITAVHTGVKFAAVGLITRELIADKMLEDKRGESEKQKDELNNRRYAQGELNKILVKIIKAL